MLARTHEPPLERRDESEPLSSCRWIRGEVRSKFKRFGRLGLATLCVPSFIKPRRSTYPNILNISLLPYKETVVARSHQLPGSDYSVSYNPRTWLATSDLPRTTHHMVLQCAKGRYNHFTLSVAYTSKYLRPKLNPKNASFMGQYA
jgi:hypothetical protein